MKAWQKGDRVVQPKYGPGTLVEVNGTTRSSSSTKADVDVRHASGRARGDERTGSREVPAQAGGEEEEAS